MVKIKVAAEGHSTASIKLQVPMDKAIHEALKTRAEELGFDSVQAYIRFWAKAEVRAPTRQATTPQTQSLDHPNAQALRYLELLLAINPADPPTLEAALDHVLKQLKRVKALHYLDGLFFSKPSNRKSHSPNSQS